MTWAPSELGYPTHEEMTEDEDSYYSHLYSTHGHTMSADYAERIARLHCTTVIQLESDHAPMPVMTEDRRRVRTLGLVLALGY